MIKDLFFWNKWDGEFKTIYQLLLLVAIALVGGYFVLMYFGTDSAINWLTTTQLESKTIVLGINNIFNIPAPVSTEASVIQQYFEGSPLKVPTYASYIYLGVFALGLIVCLTVATYLSRFYFLISTALFIFLLFLIKLNTLSLFGLEGNVNPIIFFILFTPISYYFQDINKNISLSIRLFSFIGLMTVSTIIIYLFSQIESPFLYLSTSIYIPAVIITVTFILLVGHEIIYVILIITTQGNEQTKTNNTKHFLILSLVYLINLTFAYMKNAGHIDWDIFYINAFILFIASAILGIWGVRDREILYRRTLPFYPYTGILYLALAIISISTVGFHFLNANDPLLEAFEDFIIFGHIGFGSMFLLYIIGNFISLLVKNLPVHKIAFKEDNFPYISARLGGIAVILAFFFLSNKAALDQAIGGYFIGRGDYYQNEGEKKSAIQNYKHASQYAIYNHRSNYSLSKLQNGKKQVLKLADIATRKNPTPYAYINHGLNYMKDGKFFDALFTLHEGISKFPESEELKNNIAVLYSGSTILDSAVYYLNQNTEAEINNGVGLTNKLALSAIKDISFTRNFPEDIFIKSERLDINANLLVNLISQPDTLLKAAFLSPNDNTLNIISYAYLNNLGIYSYGNPNNSFLPLVEAALSNPENGFYTEQLLFLKALNLYNNGQVNDAFQVISQLTSTYSGDGKYAFIAGLWSLEQNSPKLSLEYLEQSIEQGSKDAKIFFPLILWLDNKKIEAISFTDKQLSMDSIDNRLSVVKAKILTKNRTAIQKLKDNFNNSISLPASNLLDEITISESENDFNNTDRLYSLIGKLNPFFTEGIKEAVNHFNAKKEEDRAYEIIIGAMEVNPYSEELVKTYIEQCFAMGLESYAETGLLKLLDILSKEAYDEYEIIFDLEKDQLQQKEDLNW